MTTYHKDFLTLNCVDTFVLSTVFSIVYLKASILAIEDQAGCRAEAAQKEIASGPIYFLFIAFTLYGYTYFINTVMLVFTTPMTVYILYRLVQYRTGGDA
jgi:hypothetical protein